MNSEKETLIQRTDKQHEGKRTIRFAHMLIVPMIVLFYIPVEVIHYILNEWIQHTVVTQQFPNASLHKKSSPCEDHNKTDKTSTEYKHAERVISQWLLYNKIAEVIPLVFVNMILPSYSDTYGRKFMFIISMVGLFVKKSMIAASIYFNLNFIYIIIAYIIEGITGASTGIVCMSYAYIADLTTGDKNRFLGIVAIEAAYLLSGLCPAFIAGYMVKSGLGYTLSAVMCASLMMIGLIIVIFFLPESLPSEKRVSRKPILITMKRTVDFYTSKGFKGQRASYVLLLLAFAVGCIGSNSRGTLETLYFLDQPFCWDPINYGYFTLVRQISKAILGTILLRPLQMCLPNEIIMIISSCSVVASYIVEGLATSVLTVYGSAVINALSFLTAPIIRGLMSTMTAQDRQGSLFASLGVIIELSALLSDLTSNLVYQATISIMNSLVFLIMAFFGGVQIILMLTFWCRKSKSKEGRVDYLNKKS